MRCALVSVPRSAARPASALCHRCRLCGARHAAAAAAARRDGCPRIVGPALRQLLEGPCACWRVSSRSRAPPRLHTPPVPPACSRSARVSPAPRKMLARHSALMVRHGTTRHAARSYLTRPLPAQQAQPASVLWCAACQATPHERAARAALRSQSLTRSRLAAQHAPLGCGARARAARGGGGGAQVEGHQAQPGQCACEPTAPAARSAARLQHSCRWRHGRARGCQTTGSGARG
jgi:hypothetical protein